MNLLSKGYGKQFQGLLSPDLIRKSKNLQKERFSRAFSITKFLFLDSEPYRLRLTIFFKALKTLISSTLNDRYR
jgi:hypothetical protein